jgi:SH3-like domain-containing protein
MVLYRWPAFIKWQRTGFYLLAVALLFSLICLIGAVGNQQYLKNNQYAILVTPDATLKSTASENAENVELIHEGIKVKIVEDNGDWMSVKLPNGETGWLHSYQIEKINPFAVTENLQQP